MSTDKKKKKKKEKVKYIDDGRTIADMSGVSGGRRFESTAKSSLKDQAKTFFAAMKMMFVPMLVTMGIISVAFLLVWLFLS